MSFPLCCPARATYYTGQYAHNHGVKWNTFPLGGFDKLKQEETLPVWLRRAGYQTTHIGKYLNETGERHPRQVPLGWSDYWGGVDPSTYDYYGMTLNHNGRLVTYPRKPRFYSTDVYAGLAEGAIRRAHRGGQAVLPQRRAQRAAHRLGRRQRGARGDAGAAAAALREPLRRREAAPVPELQRGRRLGQAAVPGRGRGRC